MRLRRETLKLNQLPSTDRVKKWIPWKRGEAMKRVGTYACMATVLLAISGVLSADDGDKPNVVTLYVDDLGYRDIGCYGGPVKTPVLDKLAAGGVRFTDFHSGAPTCSPSRATFLTGRQHCRTGVYSVITERLHKMQLRRQVQNPHAKSRPAGQGWYALHRCSFRLRCLYAFTLCLADWPLRVANRIEEWRSRWLLTAPRNFLSHLTGRTTDAVYKMLQRICRSLQQCVEGPATHKSETTIRYCTDTVITRKHHWDSIACRHKLRIFVLSLSSATGVKSADLTTDDSPPDVRPHHETYKPDSGSRPEIHFHRPLNLTHQHHQYGNKQ